MTVPDEFKIVSRRIFQDAADLFPSTEAMASFAVATLDAKQSEALKTYLDDLLNGQHDIEEIERIWWEGGAELYFPKADHLVLFLKTMRAVLNGEVGHT
jgi:hypothetical protein